MTNGEKFKTSRARKVAYSQYCDDCARNNEGAFRAIAREQRRAQKEKKMMRELADRIEAAWNRRAR